MNSTAIIENMVESTILDCFEGLGYATERARPRSLQNVQGQDVEDLGCNLGRHVRVRWPCGT